MDRERFHFDYFVINLDNLVPMETNFDAYFYFFTCSWSPNKKLFFLN